MRRRRFIGQGYLFTMLERLPLFLSRSKMKIAQIRTLTGSNVWSAGSVIEAELAPGPVDADKFDPQACVERISKRFPQLRKDILGLTWRCWDDAVASLGVILQRRAGHEIWFGKSAFDPSWPSRKIAIEFEDESLGKAALESAVGAIGATIGAGDFSLAEAERHLAELAFACKLPASTRLLAEAARQRGIPVQRLHAEYSRYLRLGHGTSQHQCLASETDQVSGLARSASTDKYLAKSLMAAAGIPVSIGRLVSSPVEAQHAAEALGFPLAVKPYDQDLQTGVCLDVRSHEQLQEAFRLATQYSRHVLVEQFAPGAEHRVLVVGDEIVAVTRIDPPLVTGDGSSTVAELVQQFNDDCRRGEEGSGCPLHRIPVDSVTLRVLGTQGMNLDSVPAQGQRVLLRRDPPYFKNGGVLVDLTNEIHPSTARHAIAAAKTLRIPVAGLDVVAIDISQPLEPQRGVFVEINAGPGLWLHMAPWNDHPSPIGEAVVASMFPRGSNGRIPVAAVLGGSGDATARRLTAAIARRGYAAGILNEDRITVGDRRWSLDSACIGQRVESFLGLPFLGAAVLEVTERQILDEGLGHDRCNVVVLTPSSDTLHGDAWRALLHSLGDDGILIVPEALAIPQIVNSIPDYQLAVATLNEADLSLSSRRREGRWTIGRRNDVAQVWRGNVHIKNIPMPADLPHGEILAWMMAELGAELMANPIDRGQG